MKTFLVSITTQVEVEAFNEEDALESVEDAFGVGDTCGLKVLEFEVLDFTEL